MKTTLTFPNASEAEDGGFLYEVNGQRYEIDRFTDVYNSIGVQRRAVASGLTDVGDKLMIALGVALKDDPDAIRALDHLSYKQGQELFEKWAEFTGAELPES